MHYQAKKVFNGFVSVRDYIVRDCIKNQEDLTIEYMGATRTFTPKQLSTAFQMHTKTFESKFGGRPYKLVDFNWYDKQNKEEARQDLQRVHQEERQQKQLF